MTINSLAVNNSTVFSGLATQTYNVTTTGLYSVSFKSFIPYFPAGTPAQSSSPSAAAVDVTLAADSGGNLNSTFWTFNSAGDLYGYYVWYNINSAGVDPAVSGRTGIEVDGATNASATTLATATRAAINASGAASYVTVSGATTHCILTEKSPGLATAAANGTASPGFSYSTTAGSYGAPEMSGFNMVIKKNTTVQARFGFPSPTQALMSGSALVSATAGDTITLVPSSLSGADAVLNAVKTVANIYFGE